MMEPVAPVAPQKPVQVTPDLDLPVQKGPTLPGGRPSPFGSVKESAAPGTGTARPAETAPADGTSPKTLPGGRPNPFGTVKETPSKEAPASTPKSQPQDDQKLLPGGRPNPFGS